MTKSILYACVGLFSISAPAFAKDVKPQKMTCEEFVGLDENVQPKVVYFIEGATKTGKAEDAVITVDEISKPELWVLAECKKDPKATVWQKVENWFKKNSRTM